CAVGLAFKNPAIEESCWLRFAPEYLTSLKLRLIDPFRAWAISALLNDLTAPAARKSRFIVPSPFTLSRAVTPYAFASDKIAGNWAFGARTAISTMDCGEA